MRPYGSDGCMPETIAVSSFSIGFDRRDAPRLGRMWQEILASQRWVEGPFNERFEALWSEWNGLPAVAMGSWSGAALAALEFFRVKGKVVLCPSNTFMATPLSALKAGARVEFYDCNREDLCGSFEDFVRKAEAHRPAAAWLVHIGGHIAFDAQKIAEFCRKKGITLLEDCAHAHGAQWNGQKPGSWGDAGVYSFTATKTISTGEGGMLVTRHPELISFARSYRNYGKPDYAVEGLNFRMNEFQSALGCIQAERLEEIVRWKNDTARRVLDPLYPNRLKLPEGMTSGLYKYIVFESVTPSTGKVYGQPCHRIMKHSIELPNSDWVAKNHWCVPLYYHPEETSDETNVP